MPALFFRSEKVWCVDFLRITHATRAQTTSADRPCSATSAALSSAAAGSVGQQRSTHTLAVQECGFMQNLGTSNYIAALLCTPYSQSAYTSLSSLLTASLVHGGMHPRCHRCTLLYLIKPSPKYCLGRKNCLGNMLSLFSRVFFQGF